MPILPIHTALSLALSCAPEVPPTTLLSVAQTESSMDTLAINDNSAKQSYHPQTLQQAVQTAAGFISLHHSVDLGIMQINSTNLQHTGLLIEDAFDPCKSMHASAQILREAYRAALRDTLSRYNTGDPVRGIVNGYVYKVEANASRMALSQPGPFPESPNPQKSSDWNVAATARRELDERAKGATSSLLTFDR